MRLALDVRNRLLREFLRFFDAGTVDVMAGDIPVKVDDPIGQVLARFKLPTPAFGNFSNGLASVNETDTVDGLAKGAAGWFRVYDFAGRIVEDGSLDEGDMKLSSRDISQRTKVRIVAWTILLPEG